MNPSTLYKLLESVLYFIVKDPRVAWFFMGIGFEALSIIIGFAFIGVSYPLVDAITGIGAGLGLIWWQRKKYGI
jgi:hypothetical protein